MNQSLICLTMPTPQVVTYRLHQEELLSYKSCSLRDLHYHTTKGTVATHTHHLHSRPVASNFELVRPGSGCGVGQEVGVVSYHKNVIQYS